MVQISKDWREFVTRARTDIKKNLNKMAIKI